MILKLFERTELNCLNALQVTSVSILDKSIKYSIIIEKLKSHVDQDHEKAKR